jgi:hypothetical protein
MPVASAARANDWVPAVPASEKDPQDRPAPRSKTVAGNFT